jgi:hypothetical protein
MEQDSEQHERVVAAIEDLREILDPRKAIHGLESRSAKAQMKARGHTERATTAARRALGVVIQRTNEVPSKTVWFLPSIVLADERASRDGRDAPVLTVVTGRPQETPDVSREMTVSTGRDSRDTPRDSRARHDWCRDVAGHASSHRDVMSEPWCAICSPKEAG